jgi:flagellar hook-length control protein FliK
MIQIEIMPQVQGDKLTSVHPGEAGDFLAQIAANGELAGLTFDQALKELLTVEGDEGELLLSLPGMPVDPMQIQTDRPFDGRLLPLTLVVDGKPLPLPPSQQHAVLTEQVVQEAVAVMKPQPPQPQPQTQMLQPEFLIQRLVENTQPQELKLQLPELGKQFLEAGKPLDASGHLSSVPLQPLQAAPVGMRPSIVMPLDLPVGQPGWDRAVGERIQWMVGQNIQQAEIKLNPPHLGPLEIKISLQNDHTSVTFVATQAPTREALEASIPRLREMFGEINLNLADVNVGQHQAGESTQDQRAQSNGTAGYGADTLSHEQLSAPRQSWVTGYDGLLDTYA